MKRALAILLALSSAVLADGGAVLFQKQEGNLQVTVFGLPSPLRAGPVDISVLVQNAETRAPVLDAQVSVSVTPLSADQLADGEVWTPPCCSMKRSDDFYAATREQAQNKLMYHTFFPIPASGQWNLAVEIRHQNGARVFVETVDVAPPQKPALAYWPLLVLPIAAVGGFAINRALR
ncbi:MAG TPA: hypothetical protein VIS74_00345 [Chthoniobacterales bacterium]